MPGRPTSEFDGKWKKDGSLSDGPDAVCKLMEVGWVLKQATKLVNTMEIQTDEQAFSGIVHMPLGLGKTVESFPWNGEARENQRRDLRPGTTEGRIETSDDPRRFVIKFKWNDPLAGEQADTYELSPDNQKLTVHQEMRVGEKQVSLKAVYNRV